jgi:hypothetical protein
VRTRGLLGHALGTTQHRRVLLLAAQLPTLALRFAHERCVPSAALGQVPWGHVTAPVVHAPARDTDTPTEAATLAFQYVMLSQPQTGS